MFRHTRSIRRLLLGRYLLATNTVSQCGLDALADVLEQRCIECASPHDWPRTLRMGTAAFLMGPVDHYWYHFLDSRFPGTGAATVARKVTLDILVYGPIGVVLFYLRKLRLAYVVAFTCVVRFNAVMCKLEGKSWNEAVKETKQKFAATYEASVAAWNCFHFSLYVA